MHSPPALTQAIAAAQHLAVPWRGLTFRVSHLQYFSNFAAAQPLFCAAAGAAGSRYVAPHGPAALYVAIDADTAYREFNQHFYRLARSRPSGRSLVRSGQLRPDPGVTLAVHVRVSRLLNVTRSSSHWRQTRRLLGIRANSHAELLQPWAGVANAPTQVLGTEVFNGGFFEGILYPSAQNPNQTCFVLFRDRLLPTSRVHFHDATTAITGQLP
jgi:hypothetical protein